MDCVVVGMCRCIVGVQGQGKNRRMLAHNHNGSLTFLVNFKLSNLNKEIKSSLRMISYEIETCRSVLNVLSAFNTGVED